jgi:hypothetical protein
LYWQTTKRKESKMFGSKREREQELRIAKLEGRIASLTDRISILEINSMNKAKAPRAKKITRDADGKFIN